MKRMSGKPGMVLWIGASFLALIPATARGTIQVTYDPIPIHLGEYPPGLTTTYAIAELPTISAASGTYLWSTLEIDVSYSGAHYGFQTASGSPWSGTISLNVTLNFPQFWYQYPSPEEYTDIYYIEYSTLGYRTNYTIDNYILNGNGQDQRLFFLASTGLYTPPIGLQLVYGGPGRIGGTVTVTSYYAESAPEPGTLAGGVVGMLAVGGGWWHRRRGCRRSVVRRE